MSAEPWDETTFVAKLREVGGASYHDKHPFHVAMNAGRLSPDAIRGWVANRFYYQANIPIKDAAILSNCPLRDVRRQWIDRIIEHDGTQGEEGGIESWLRLGRACGLRARRHARAARRHPRRALRRRCLPQLLPHEAVAGRGRIVAHGALRART